MPAEFDVIEVRSLTDAEHADELVCAAVEGSLAGIRLRPYHEVERRSVDRLCGCHELGNVPPVHAYEVNGAVA